jgi:hypothetical protein
MKYLSFTGTTYSSMRRQIDRDILKQFPFSMAETFRGQIEKVSFVQPS